MKTEERESITLMNRGEKMFGIMHRPLSKGAHPVVLFCPGLAGTKSGRYRMFVSLAQELTKNGIGVFRFDYRGAGDSEGEFHDMTVSSKVEDTLVCLDFLLKSPDVDTNKIGILGRSLGGAIALLSACHFGAIKSIALWSPLFDGTPWKPLWEKYQSQSNHVDQSQLLQSIHAPIPNLEFIKQVIQIDMRGVLAKLTDIPMLHIQGEKDTIVDMRHALAYQEARKSTSQTKFIPFPEGDHEYSNPQDQAKAIKETTEWFIQTLL